MGTCSSYLTVCFWVISLRIMASNSMHTAEKYKISFFQVCLFICLGWVVFYGIHMYTTFLKSRSSANEHLGWFNDFAIVNVLQYTYECRYLFGFAYIPSSEFAGSVGNCIFSSFRSLHTVFHRGRINVHSHQQHIKISFSQHPPQHVVFWFFNNSHSVGYKIVFHCGFNLYFFDD